MSKNILSICFLAVGIAAIAIFIFKVPLSSIFTFGIFLLCPLMHLLMMKGHGNHKNKENDSKQKGKPCH